MSNSSLATYTNISENKTSPRNATIDTVSVHVVVAQWTAQQTVDYLQPSSKKASCNYAVGKDGSIAIGVQEKDRSWCTSDSSNDHRAITIEVASDTTDPYAVTDAAYNALVKLLVDICQRNPALSGGLKWQGDKDLIGTVSKQNMTVHRWFAAKACPGDYLYNLHGQIAADVNALLAGSSSEATTDPSTTADTLYRVQTGAFSKKDNADAQLAKVAAAGFDTYMVESNGLYKIQVGAYSVKANAEAQAEKLEKAGFETYITINAGTGVVETSTISYYPSVSYTGSSLVDCLDKMGVDSSLANRKLIAAANNISSYTGTASQNTALLTLAKAGKLIKA